MISQVVFRYIEDYDRLSNSSVLWICYKCDTPNFDNSFFRSYELDVHNSLSILDDASDVFRSSSIQSPTGSFHPPYYSSPKDALPSLSTISSRNQQSTSPLPPKKPQNLRTLVVNCGGLKNKAPTLQTTLLQISL